MPPTIHFVRHAQGFHNLNTANHSIHDPLLTPFGQQQCRNLAATFPYTSTCELIVASPLKRTIYTALLSLPSHTKLTLIALPEIQETSDHPCDTGSSKAEIEREFATSGRKIDLHLVGEDWNSKKGRWAPSKQAVEERCKVARRWLRDRKEKDVVCVTHGGVLHYLTEDWSDSNKFEGTGWANTEYRSYTFDPNSGDNASLIETEESRTRRRGQEKPLTESERRNLHMTESTGSANVHANVQADMQANKAPQIAAKV